MIKEIYEKYGNDIFINITCVDHSDMFVDVRGKVHFFIEDVEKIFRFSAHDEIFQKYLNSIEDKIVAVYVTINTKPIQIIVIKDNTK